MTLSVISDRSHSLNERLSDMPLIEFTSLKNQRSLFPKGVKVKYKFLFHAQDVNARLCRLFELASLKN